MAVLDAHPEMKAALTIVPKAKRPSLREFLGWRTVVTHQKQELTKAALGDALDGLGRPGTSSGRPQDASRRFQRK